jgi:hypothetical protein
MGFQKKRGGVDEMFGRFFVKCDSVYYALFVWREERVV